MRFRFGFLGLSLVFGVLLSGSPALAMNQWYQQGFNDGISYQDQVCRATIDQQVSVVQQENTKLRAELARLQAALQNQQAQPQNQAYLNGPTGTVAAKSRYYDQVDD
ncbi:MAG: hypothetical protein ACKO57_04365 [Alphaproteobacteria bacterium]